MIDTLWIKILAVITLIGSAFAALKVKEAKDISKGRDEVAQENTKQALDNVIKSGENDEEIQDATRDELIKRGRKWMRKS